MGFENPGRIAGTGAASEEMQMPKPRAMRVEAPPSFEDKASTLITIWWLQAQRDREGWEACHEHHIGGILRKHIGLGPWTMTVVADIGVDPSVINEFEEWRDLARAFLLQACRTCPYLDCPLNPKR
jgi:hypothetical protein